MKCIIVLIAFALLFLMDSNLPIPSAFAQASQQEKIDKLRAEVDLLKIYILRQQSLQSLPAQHPAARCPWPGDPRSTCCCRIGSNANCTDRETCDQFGGTCVSQHVNC